MGWDHNVANYVPTALIIGMSGLENMSQPAPFKLVFYTYIMLCVRPLVAVAVSAPPPPHPHPLAPPPVNEAHLLQN